MKTKKNNFNITSSCDILLFSLKKMMMIMYGEHKSVLNYESMSGDWIIRRL
jgi:hypothetical protein